MAIQLPQGASHLFDQAEDFNFDNSKVLAYRLKDLEAKDLTEACERATESYARKVLNWPSGRMEKPAIFDVVDSKTGLEDINACLRGFVRHFQGLLGTDPPKTLPTYYRAFVVMSKDELPDQSTIVLIHKPEEEWQVDCVRCPVEAELGLTVTSLMMGDETVEDVLGRLGR